MSGEECKKTRDALVADLRKYLVGPIEEDEIIQTSHAWERYHTGFLNPMKTEIDEEENEQDRLADDYNETSGGGDSILTLANLYRQSAMGMTFRVKKGVSEISVKVEWADYEGQEVEEKEKPGKRGKKNKRKIWVRKPFQDTLKISLKKEKFSTEIDGIRIEAIIRKKDCETSVTLSIVNGRSQTQPSQEDNSIYQVKITAFSPDKKEIFTDLPPYSHLQDEETINFELLYHEVKPFAVGHGIAVLWETFSGKAASKIWTEWIPETEVFKASARVLEGASFLSLSKLHRENHCKEVCGELKKLPQAYEQWIQDREKEIASIARTFPLDRQKTIKKAAQTNLKKCRQAKKRMEEGIELLSSNPTVWKAFCLAMMAMEESMKKSRPGREPGWRAFQLAFILLSLPSTAIKNHQDREKLDLIWFPTGGGKTEAYLGLSCFVLFYRRLSAPSPDQGAGTAVFTRYTLRLLTVQQFERATRTVCACEIIRRQNKDLLGDQPFTTGLFVGSAATPNKMEDVQALLQGREGNHPGQTTLPLLRCPWCGTELEMECQSIDGNQLITPCPNKNCEFHPRIPIVFVDEEIYEYPPSLVVGTIDKFAMMAWRPEIRAIFGRGKTSYPPPDLIIQDELHLIGDSLGTISALYELVIDHLCKQGEHIPKVIGSTATIRRAEEQCRDLFVREAVQFPPSGITVTDSFFYRENRESPGRLYVGVHAQGRSPKTTWAQIVGILSQSVSQIQNPKIQNIYYTLIAYFNSLRELGGALVLSEDAVPRYMDAMPLALEQAIRKLPQIKELTSNLPSHRVAEMLKDMETPVVALMNPNEMDREPLDLVLSTNMISVGVDVDRLGLMVVTGQPKTTSEYIQATSRVGRPEGDAGLVVTLYNWTRPRDRSHYERFVDYHRAFYRYVESTSVTPFSARARDRALHGVLFSLVRMTMDEMGENNSAGAIQNQEVENRVRDLMEIILQRVEEVDPDEKENTREDLEDLIDDWIGETDSVATLYWRKHPAQDRTAMMRWANSENEDHGLWPTPTSMRDVEPPSPVWLLTKRQLDQI